MGSWSGRISGVVAGVGTSGLMGRPGRQTGPAGGGSFESPFARHSGNPAPRQKCRTSSCDTPRAEPISCPWVPTYAGDGAVHSRSRWGMICGEPWKMAGRRALRTSGLQSQPPIRGHGDHTFNHHTQMLDPRASQDCKCCAWPYKFCACAMRPRYRRRISVMATKSPASVLSVSHARGVKSSISKG